MRLIPVMDLSGGIVVHAIAGKRDQYRPIQSKLRDSAAPLEIAAAFREQFGFSELYVADLDAIRGGVPDWNSIAALSESGFDVWLDGGRGVLQAAESETGSLHRIILATEWISSFQELRQAVSCFGTDRVVFGLDLKDGVAVTRCSEWSALPHELVDQGASFGIRNFVLLDVARVGVGGGADSTSLSVCRRMADDPRSCEVVTGGGIRSTSDLAEYQDAGCTAVLLASALHNGSMRPDEIRR